MVLLNFIPPRTCPNLTRALGLPQIHPFEMMTSKTPVPFGRSAVLEREDMSKLTSKQGNMEEACEEGEKNLPIRQLVPPAGTMWAEGLSV